MILRIAKLGLAAAGLLALGTSGNAGAPASTATLWHGGTIITMDGPAPRTVQAVVERDGKIVFAGPEARARQLAGRNANDRDLHGATMLPGFVDAHSHFSMLMQMASGVDLDAGDEPPRDIPSLTAMVRAGIEARHVPEGEWFVGWNYKEGPLAEKRHVTREDLDAAFPHHKVVLIHFTGHGLVANSAALAAAG